MRDPANNMQPRAIWRAYHIVDTIRYPYTSMEAVVYTRDGLELGKRSW